MASDDKSKPLLVTVAEIALMPLALAGVGYLVSSAIKKDELEVERLKLAISILTTNVENESMRKFGVQLLSVSVPAGVLAPDLAQALTAGKTLLPPPTRALLTGGLSSAEWAARPNAQLLICGSNLTSLERLSAEKIEPALNAAGFAPYPAKGWNSSAQDEKGKTTIYVDADHAEKDYVEKIKATLSAFPDLPPIRIVNNTGSPSPWYFGIVVCP